MRLILKPHFWIYIYLFQTIFFSSKSYDKRDDFNFDTVYFPVWMVPFPVLPLTRFVYLTLFDLLERLSNARHNV